MSASVLRRNMMLTFAVGFSMHHVRLASAAESWFFSAWSFSQSASPDVGHGALESAGFF